MVGIKSLKVGRLKVGNLLILAGMGVIAFAWTIPQFSKPFWVFGLPKDFGIVREEEEHTARPVIFNPHFSTLTVRSTPSGCLAVDQSSFEVKIPPFSAAEVLFSFTAARIAEGNSQQVATFVGKLGDEPVEVRIPFRFTVSQRTKQ